MSYTKLPAITGTTACLTCGCGSHDTFGPENLIAVGFGSAMVLKNGDPIYDEQSNEHAGRDYWIGKDAENVALKDPDNDWRIQINAPLYDAEYQRQGPGHWVFVSKGQGFA